jgi:putative spermidine/putrescine transport system permease protein
MRGPRANDVMAVVSLPMTQAAQRSGRHPFLRRALHRAERRRTWLAIALIAPLAIFLLLNFFVPIGMLLARGVTEHEVPLAWPRTAAALRNWDGTGLPDPAIIEAFLAELAASSSSGKLSAAANRLNYDLPGSRSLIIQTAAALRSATRSDPLSTLIAIDARWGERQTWIAIQHAAGPYTSFYLLATLDLRLDADGNVARTPPDQAVFVDVFARTFWISAVVVALCALLGYPLAYVMARLPERYANPLLILVLLPFWTSVLVRTTAWMVLLQDRGLINDLLLRLGVISQPLQLIYNRAGVYVAMTHVLLPYFVLPLYGVMKRVPPFTMRAALSLGATPLQAFWRVYFPQTRPGVAAGALIVFILSLGYYITPALVGGAADQMISYFIAFYTNQSLNWGMAAALSLVLLLATVVLLLVYWRVAGRRELAMR